MTTTKATVTGVDVYAWMTPVEGTIPTRFTHNSAKRGDVIEVTAEELKRGVDAGNLTAGEVKTNKRGQVIGDVPADNPDLGPDATDEDLAELDAPQLVAWIGQNPDEADRVAELEGQRKNPRKTVLRAAGVEVE